MPRPTLDLSDQARVRLLIVSDTHGALDARIASLAERADAVVHAGDVGADAVLVALRQRPLVAVEGNNDTAAKWQGSERARQRLHEQALIALPGGRLAVEHGHRAGAAKDRHQRLRQRHPDVRAIVYGHSHRQVIDDEVDPWVLNPGAAGRTRTFGGPSYLWLHAGPRRWRVTLGRLPSV